MTTIRIGGITARLWCPENDSDLKLCPRQPDGTYRVISGGSNLLISDLRTYDNIIYMGLFDKSIQAMGHGRYRVGSSVRIQNLIRRINDDGYGGIEELYSIPAMVGGLICMNASVPSSDTCISRYLESVEVFDGSRVSRYSKDECGFAYRRSRFQNGRMIILSAIFAFPSQEIDVSKARIKERIQKVKTSQDHSHPNFGTVFRACDSRIMRAIRRFHIHKGGASFSAKTANWILSNQASFSEVVACIKLVSTLHRLLFRKCELEVVIWE